MVIWRASSLSPLSARLRGRRTAGETLFISLASFSFFDFVDVFVGLAYLIDGVMVLEY